MSSGDSSGTTLDTGVDPEVGSPSTESGSGTSSTASETQSTTSVEEETQDGGEDVVDASGSSSTGIEDVSSGESGLGPDCDQGPPACVPGEPLCHPLEGYVVGCDDCGQFVELAQAEPCVRSLTSDRESGILCLLRGPAQLECGGPLGWPPVFAPEISEGVVRLAVADDGTVYQGSATPFEPRCELLPTGGVRCFGLTDAAAFEAQGRTDCTKVVVNDQPQPGACGLCGGTLLCSSEALLPAPLEGVLDFDATDGQVHWIAEDGIHRNLDDAWLFPGSYVSLFVNHEGGVCGLTPEHALRCGRSSDAEPFAAWAIDASPATAVVLNTWPHASVLAEDGRVLGVDLDARETIFTHSGPFVEIQGSAGFTCGRSRLGEVECWDPTGQALPVFPEL